MRHYDEFNSTLIFRTPNNVRHAYVLHTVTKFRPVIKRSKSSVRVIPIAQPAKIDLNGQIGRHWLAGNFYFPHGRIFISCFSEPLGINIEILNGLLLW